MTADSLFTYCNYLAMLGWLILIISPWLSILKKIVVFGIIPILLSLIYLFLIVNHFGEAEGDFGSLQGVMSLFTNEYAVLGGWVHYLAFDLWVGTWEVDDAKKHGIHHLLLIPCLFFTFMFGPIGLLLYFLLRIVMTRKPIHENFQLS
jgi:hypothetical protein